MAWAAAILQLVTTVRATDARCLAHGSRWLTNKSASFACSPGAKNKPAKQTTDKLLLYTVRSAKGVQRWHRLIPMRRISSNLQSKH